MMVAQAHLAAATAIAENWKEHDLTWGEILAFHAKETASCANYIIRTDRHPDDPSKKGDEA